MGKVNDSILAGTSGRTGRVVIANINGTEYIRIRPKKSSKAPTTKQLLIQQRMKLTIEFMTSYRPFACKHYGQRSGIKSCYNMAMANILDSLEINFETAEINTNYPLIAFSKGILPTLYLKELTKTEPLTINLSWFDNAGNKPERENDMLQILIAAQDEFETYFLEDLAPRSANNFLISIPNQLEGKTLHLYAAFKSSDDKSVSNSTYIGSVS